ncbi:choice-of-anchor M domain-containing protein [Buchananella hordeovulneris]|uniref:choice-of-anchor M domain-containing protein n=1 Tax=Buchananella hordeovulneris TaxID=52770 RepID=UPI000F5EB8EE|nr:choice-of-anchor M domain-containing protein [Buchananella hordeovulneris]MDO5079884.1 choice-of-anchor M domain-containing protein [Buchananella hordeovulneris]RRD43035.1 tRNA-dihydrouridine synthase [Buchananella hordeovulneris]
MLLRRFCTGLLATLALACLPGPAHAAPKEDPDLQQTLGNLAVATDERVLTTGHVDMGPKFVDGRWVLMIHDDVARAGGGGESVWRYPDATVLQIKDAAKLPVPDDPAYEFLAQPAGTEVWVMPQTQHPDVVWLGWNTQDPEVMSRIDRGVTLSLEAVQGPGDVLMYLQSGSFGAPEVLWDSRQQAAQPIWVDVNTHTHSNWVFTQPGVYLLQVKASADLVDGNHVEDTRLLRFAVGDATEPRAAQQATWQGPAPTSATASATAAATPAAASGAPSQANPIVVVLVIAIAVVVLAVLVGVVLTVRARGSARSQVEAARGKDTK